MKLEPQIAETQRERRALRRRRVGRKLARGERGVALLLVLTAIALLYVMAQQSRDEVELYSTAASASRDQVIAYYQAKSMVNLSRLLLHAEPTIRRGITPILGPIMLLMTGGLSGASTASLAVPQIPIWEQADILLGMFRNRASATGFGQMVGADFSTARGLGGISGAQPPVIVDEDSKINVNGLDRSVQIETGVGRQLKGLFASPSLDLYFTTRDSDQQFTDRLLLIGAMLDYADSDTTAYDVQSLYATSVSGSGAGTPEDNFYSSIRPTYMRRNAPFDSLEELHMVRGLGDDDLWRTVVDPNPGDPHRRTLTVWGQGLVNVNTANAQTIVALICAFAAANTPQCTDASQYGRLIMGITMIQSMTLSMGIPVFTSPSAFVTTIQGQGQMGTMLTGMLGVQPITITGSDLQHAVTTESKVFSIYADAAVGLAHVRIHAVVDMRAQPAVPGTFLSASGGSGSNREATASTTVVAGASGVAGQVSSAGGTLVYWREE